MKAKDASLYPSSSSLLYNTPRVGDKRQRGGNYQRTDRNNTTNDNEICPSVDDALPTARPNNNKVLSDADDAIITDTTNNDNNETVMNNNNDNNTAAAENDNINDNDDDDAMEDNSDRPTKRLKM